MSKNFLIAIYFSHLPAVFMIGCEIHYHISKQGADRMQSGVERSPVCAVSLSPDGQHIFSSSDDSSVQYMCVQVHSCRRLGSEPISPRRGSCNVGLAQALGTRDDQEAHRDEGRVRPSRGTPGGPWRAGSGTTNTV
jgi:hypothetical protein